MAEISYTKPDDGPDYIVYFWEGATNGGAPDTFTPVKLERTPYSISAQVEDADAWAAASGPNIAIQGSLDGSTYYPLQDAGQVDIDITANSFVISREVPLWIRPALTNGDAGTDIDVRILVRFDTK